MWHFSFCDLPLHFNSVHTDIHTINLSQIIKVQLGPPQLSLEFVTESLGTQAVIVLENGKGSHPKLYFMTAAFNGHYVSMEKHNPV